MSGVRVLRSAVWCLAGCAAVLAADADAPRILKFDFGPEKQRVMPGFLGVDPTVVYDAARGYGLTNKPRPVQGAVPDDLCNDAMASVAFRVDVPDGSYLVGTWTGHLQDGGNYIFSRGFSETVQVNGVSLRDLRLGPEDYVRRYFFRHADIDLTPDADVWGLFIDDAFSYDQAQVQVKGGRLEAQTNEAAYLNGLIVCPEALKDRLAAELAAVAAARRGQFEKEYPPSARWRTPDPPDAGEEDRRFGYVVGLPDPMALASISGAPTPEERAGELRLFASRGEYEPATLTVFPLEDADALTATWTPLKADGGGAAIPPENVSVHLVRLVLRGGRRYEPFYLAPCNQAPLRRHLLRQFWFTLRVPPDARPGLYRGAVELTSARGVRRVPVTLRALDLYLPDVTQRQSGAPLLQLPYYGCQWYSWLFPFPDFAKRKKVEAMMTDLRFMRERGVAPSFTLYDTTQVEFYRMTREAGFNVPISDYGYGGQRFALDWNTNTCAFEKTAKADIGTPEFEKALHDLLDKLVAEWNQGGLPPDDMILSISDEVGSHLGERGVRREIEIVKAFKRFGKVRHLVFANDRCELAVLPWADWFVPNNSLALDETLADTIRRSGATFGIYNLGLQRITFGFYPWRLGARIVWCWHYFTWRGAVVNPFDGDSMSYFVVPGPDGPLPTHSSEMVREGVDDLRYALALERLMVRASASRDPAVAQALQAAEQARGQVWDRVDHSLNLLRARDVWTWDTLQKTRWRLARAALDLQEALRRAGVAPDKEGVR
jgi:hypothetical protein